MPGLGWERYAEAIYNDIARSNFREKFQGFILEFCKAVYGVGNANEVRLAQGDGGVDVYVISEQAIYQCYGPPNWVEATAIQKLKDDFEKALTTSDGLLREWWFIHNQVEGAFSKDVVKASFELQMNTDVVIKVLNPRDFWQRIKKLDRETLAGLLGIPATLAELLDVPHEIPQRANMLFGRDALVATLTERLRDRKNTTVVGPAGFGKTALAGEALVQVFGETRNELATELFPDGIIYVDLYSVRANTDQVFGRIVESIQGSDFEPLLPALERVRLACRGKKLLLMIEGAEEATGGHDRVELQAIKDVLAEGSRWLMLTRDVSQSKNADRLKIDEPLAPADAEKLFDHLTDGGIDAEVKASLLELLAGHPLAITWAAGLLDSGGYDPQYLVAEFTRNTLLSLRDPGKRQHTLKWLFERSVRDLDKDSKLALTIAGVLAHAPFDKSVVDDVLSEGIAGSKRADEALAVLVKRSLLDIDECRSRWQFTHVLAYKFARETLEIEPKYLEEIAKWVNTKSETSLNPEAIPGDIYRMDRYLEHALAVMERGIWGHLWSSLIFPCRYKYTIRLVALGRLASARVLTEGIYQWMQRFRSTNSPDSERELSSVLTQLGDIQCAQGDLAGGLASHQASLKIAKALTDSDPGNKNWKRDLSVSHIKVSDIQRAQGELASALTSCQTSLQILKFLSESDSADTGWKRDLGVCHNRVSDIQRAQGDLAGALTSCQTSLHIFKLLSDSDSSDAGWQRDLSVSHLKVGDIRVLKGDRIDGLASYEVSLKICRSLFDSDRTNAGWAADYVGSLLKVGAVWLMMGKIDFGMNMVDEANIIAAWLAQLDPTNVEWKKNLSRCHALKQHALDLP